MIPTAGGSRKRRTYVPLAALNLPARPVAAAPDESTELGQLLRITMAGDVNPVTRRRKRPSEETSTAKRRQRPFGTTEMPSPTSDAQSAFPTDEPPEMAAPATTITSQATMNEWLAHLQPVCDQDEDDVNSGSSKTQTAARLAEHANVYAHRIKAIASVNPELHRDMSTANPSKLVDLVSWTTLCHWLKHTTTQQQHQQQHQQQRPSLNVSKLEWAEASLVQLCAIVIGARTPLAMSTLSWGRCSSIVTQGQWGASLQSLMTSTQQTLWGVLVYNRALKGIPAETPNAFVSNPVVDFARLLKYHNSTHTATAKDAVPVTLENKPSVRPTPLVLEAPDFDDFLADLQRE